MITIDTELSSSLHAAGLSSQCNIQRSIFGNIGAQSYGIHWQMDQMDKHGIKGVFFVDPMPALVYGPECLSKIVDPILSRGHEVQIHIHTEWLRWATDSPVPGRHGQNIGDFTLEEQVILINWARDALLKAGAPMPTAFRAGNFGANDSTLLALAQLDIPWDSSFNLDYTDTECGITGNGASIDPWFTTGVTELPIAGIWDRRDHFRPAQVCALSKREMHSALHHAAITNAPLFVILTHSFEMLSRDRLRPNKIVMRRFAALCNAVARQPLLQPSNLDDLNKDIGASSRLNPTRLPPNRIRTMRRIGEQAISTWLFERRLTPQ